MDKLKSATNNYLNFKINKEEYEKIINIKGILFSPKKQVLVSAKNVITAIQKLLSKEITIQELVDWVNIIWFSEAYSFIEEEANSIVSVLDQLECLDEENVFFTNEQYSQMISSLNSNTEFDHLYV